MEAKTLEATPETDKALKQEYYLMGIRDRMRGDEPQLEATNGLIYEWYMLGYNAIMAD